MMSTKDIISQASSEFGMGGTNSDIFQFKKSGEYLIRVLTIPAPLGMHFFGKGSPSVVCIGMEKNCPFHGLTPEGEQGKIDPKTNAPEEYKRSTVKFMVYLIDREQGKIQLGELPWSVIKEVGDLEENPDWKFDSYPMPYDIRVKVDKENQDPKQVYKVFPSPKMTVLSQEEQDSLLDKVTKVSPADFVAKRKERQKQKFIEDGTMERMEAKGAQINKDSIAQSKVAPEDDYPMPEGDPAF